MMDREHIQKLADSHEAIADRAYRNHQETGDGRFYSKYKREQELSDALRIAANAADDNEKFYFLKGQLSDLTYKAVQIKSGYVPKDVADKEKDRIIDSLAALASFVGVKR